MLDTQNNQSDLEIVNSLLSSFGHFGVELGLERIQSLLAALGNPEQNVPFLHVAGSNGKGSVCAYLSSVLTTAGYQVGRYTSPHLVSWCERICLNQEPIAPADLRQVLQQAIAAIDPNASSPTQFELITAAAWLTFAQHPVDIAVMEVGLGGRLDATNVAKPLISAITSLSREHWQRLGPTLADIAGEKAGILKSACPAVVGQLPLEAAQVVYQKAAMLDCPVIEVLPAVEVKPGWAEWRSPVTNQIWHYPTALAGPHQLQNSAIALTILELLRQQGWQMTDEQIVSGMEKTRWAARLQWLQWHDREILIDAAHNSAGAAVLRQFVDRCDRLPKPVHWVMGLLDNKDHTEIFQALLRPGDRLSLVPVPDHITADPAQLATLAKQICPTLESCDTHATAPDAIEAVFTATADESPAAIPVLCGSIYMIGDFFKRIGIEQV